MEKTDRKLASALMDIGAVLLRPENPFVWASGWHSPVYCDNRRILSDPALRKLVASRLAEVAKTEFPDAQIVAGVATGAIAHGVLVADLLEKPFVYVRSKPKDHGTGSQIEGVLPKNSKVVVIEDLISTGMSSLAAVQALQDAGAEVLGMVAIFTYGFDVATEKFKDKNLKLVTLSNYNVLIDLALEREKIKTSELEKLNEWRKSPSTWNVK
ncbi:MAG: orotate phosphoribosyltransferase [Candidatus Cryptobacteroides sp.]